MSIQKREVLYSRVNGKVKFHDWAITTTTIGACAEPFVANQKMELQDGFNVSDFDHSDMMNRVDGLVLVDGEDDVKRHLFQDNGKPLHGGNLHPRVFLKSGNF